MNEWMDNIISLALVGPGANWGWGPGGLPASHLVLASPPFFPGATIGSQELPWPDSVNMEGAAENAPCEHFEVNELAQSCCQNCLQPEEAHRARHQVGRLSRVVSVVWGGGVRDGLGSGWATRLQWNPDTGLPPGQSLSFPSCIMGWWDHVNVS